MQGTLSGDGKECLEGLCDRPSGDGRAARAYIRMAPGCDGIERMEARLIGRAFSPHRHDTYAIGLTLAGVQTFRYRGAQRHSLPGQCHILHPDELHDGGSGNDGVFAYRIFYIDPALVQKALGGRPLPFVPNPVVDLTRRQKGLLGAAWDVQTRLDDVERADIASAVADILLDAATGGARSSTALCLDGLSRVRALIAAQPAHRPATDELERVAGLDRWSLARQFRAAFGTSPSRFRTLRQLDEVRRLLERGTSLAVAALEAGFADQSHMSRQFKRAYGLTPARWAAALC